MKWKMVNLCEVADILNGYAFKSKDYVHSGYKVVRITNVQKGRFADSNPQYITSDIAKKYKAFYLYSGDILISLTGNVGRVCLLSQQQEPAVLNQRVGAIRVKSDSVCLKYLFHFLNSEKFEREAISNSNGIAQLNLSLNWVKKYKIPLPPLEEQKRIAAILDKADSIRKKRREALEKCDEFLKHTFLNMFGDPVTNPKGWDIVKLGELVSEIKYGTSSRASDVGNYPILRMGNITYSGNWDFKDLKYINLKESEYEKYLVRRGDILFNRTNSKELVGKTAVYREEYPMAYAGYLIRVRPNEENNSEYIAGYLNSPYMKIFLKEKCKSIVGMANINAKELQNFRIMKVPLPLQVQFAKIVGRTETMKSRMRSSLKKLDNNFNKLMQMAFKGEL